MNLQTLKLLTDWTRRTEYILRLEKKRWEVGETGSLDRSLDTRVIRLAESMLESQLEFLVRGRFVDMGAGRARKIESRGTNADLIRSKSKSKPRKPKRWYSRAYYGRINDLQGVLGYQLMESAIQSVKDPLRIVSTGNVGNPSRL